MIVSIQDLMQAMDIDVTIGVKNIEKVFSDIADALLNRFVIQTEGKKYHFIEIEFYHNKTDDRPNITIQRKTAVGEWFMHESGVDLCFNSDEENYGGILIRTIRCGEEYINGPRKVMWEIFANMNAFSNPNPASLIPMIVPIETEEKPFKPIQSLRHNVKNSQKEYRFTTPPDKWKNHSKYTAYPFDYNGNVKPHYKANPPKC